MFANQSDDSESTETESTEQSENKFFDERSEIHEVYWIACDANRRNGPQILTHEDLHTKETDDGVSAVVDDYRFFQSQKKDLIEEITGERDEYGLRKYREDFPEPDEDLWVEAGTEHYGIPIVGVHQIPADEAMERFDVDYEQDGIDPIYVPVIEDPDTGEEVVYDPDNYYEGEAEETAETEESEPEPEAEAEAESEAVEQAANGGQGPATSEAERSTDEGTTSEPDFPADPDTVMAHLEEQPLDDLTKQARATLAKLRDPTRSNREIAGDIDCSKNTVRKGLQKYLGDEGYERLKARGKELREQEQADAEEQAESDETSDYEEQMMATTSGDAETESGDESRETVEVDAEAFAELEARVERLESMFDAELLERV